MSDLGIINYTVTRELKTPWWKKLLRFFGLTDPREEFDIQVSLDAFDVGDILSMGDKAEVLLVSKTKY